MLFDVLSELFNYVTNIIDVSMSMIANLHVFDARLSLYNHAIDEFYIFIFLSLMDRLIYIQCHLVYDAQCSNEHTIYY